MASLGKNHWEPNIYVALDGRIHFDDLVIAVKRTIRVPDNQQVSQLPPDMGTFQLERISNFEDTAPDWMVAKGGLFFPMRRKFQ